MRGLAVLLKGLIGSHGQGLLLHQHITFHAPVPWTLISIALAPARWVSLKYGERWHGIYAVTVLAALP